MAQYGDWITTPPLLVVLSGPSGVGKTSLCNRLVEVLDDAVYSISVTTRPKRPGDDEGKEYSFVSPDEFERLRSRGQLLEWAKVHGHEYGTPRPFVERQMAEGKTVVLNIDVQGGVNVMKAFPDGVFIFVMPPTIEALVERIAARGGDAKETVRLRMQNAPVEIAEAERYQYVVLNDDFEQCLERLEAIVTAERSLRRRCFRPTQNPTPGA